MKKLVLAALALAFSALPKAAAQDYTAPDQFDFWIEKDLVYGISIDYLGRPDTLRLDILKPVGDGNRRRPLVVLAHGGSWLTGCKSDPAGIRVIAEKLVRHGYSVASIDYRLGWHKAAFVPTPAGPPIWPEVYGALYAADSCEILRAIFRGQQDLKGAVRFLKNRAEKDSTCTENVFVGGESAGGFVALAAAFLDRNSEKPDCCFDLADAPPPQANLPQLTTPDCQPKKWTLLPTSLFRPDLGEIDGILNQNGQNSNVAGVLNFYGGVPYEALSKDWLGGPDTPAVYLFHQTCDGVVPHQIARPTWIISDFCNLGATPWATNYPLALGSGAMAAFFAASPQPPLFKTDFLPCQMFEPALALLDCIRYAQNGSYHFTADAGARANIIAAFLQPIIDQKKAACQPVVVENAAAFSPFQNWKIAPNPTDGPLLLQVEKAPNQAVWVELFDGKGQLRAAHRLVLHDGSNDLFEAEKLENGLFFVKITAAAGVFSSKIFATAR